MHAFHRLAVAAALAPVAAQAQMALPGNAVATCTADVAAWRTDAGTVAPPDSLTFTDDHGGDPSACDFYNWGAHAFLWLTGTENGALVLDGPAIRNVLPDTGGVRRYQADPDAPLAVAPRDEKDVGEIGQAGGGGVLMSQAGALVHYGVHTNDLYAYFLTGQKAQAGGIDPAPAQFAHNRADMDALDAYLATAFPGTRPAAPGTLVMELKTSWVDAASLADPAGYVTMPALVPTYTPNADNTEWVPGPPAPATLALVGIHIVGTVQDHPEFVWATFEHVANAPDAAYYYTDEAGRVVPFPYDGSGDFLFLAPGAEPAGANVECMTTQGGTATGAIVAVTANGAPACPGGIVPSDTVRARPWGSFPYGPPDIGRTIGGVTVTQAMVDQIVANNTMMLSINASVRGQLAPGDVRANYVQTGAIWTAPATPGGTAPVPDGNDEDTAQMRGALGLYNATMETYSFDSAPHCFACHALFNGPQNMFGTADAPDQLSHIYYALEPLAAP